MRKELIKSYIKNKLAIKNVYDIYDRQQLIYIHVPKAAGNSICRAIFGEDPHHFSAKELKIINSKKYNNYSKAAFIRDPLERLISTYQYSISHVREQPDSSISFMSEFSSFDDFVQRGLTRYLVKKHYFFWTQDKYIERNIDFIGRFECIENDFKRMIDIFNIQADLYHGNKSIPIVNPLDIKEKNLHKIYNIYNVDYERFEYAKCFNNDKLNVI